MNRALPVGLASLAIAALLAAPLAPASAGPLDTYAAAATVVVKDAGQQAVLDNGGVVCVKSNPAPSIGGGCVAFGASVRVQDAALGNNVAFQVCIDNNGDGVCAAEPGQSRQCGDDIFFSHDDKGTFHNPLGPLPGGFRWGCHGGPWKGYVVFLCDGVHNAGGAHAHTATTGSIAPTPLPGTGFGDFCNPGPTGPPKQYVVV